MINEKISELIADVSENSITDFVRQQNRSCRPVNEDLTHLLSDNLSFCQLTKLGEIEYADTDRLLVFSCLYDGELSARTSRKMQFEIAKKALTADFKDGAIFVFYDARGTFRFSFIRRNYGQKEQKYSNWKRFTYYVEPNAQTNRTFIERVGGCKFESLDGIQQAFSVEQLTKDFYKELSNWYFWAIKCVSFPNDVNDDADDVKFNSENVIRLITRLIFAWFLKQKDLIKPELFDTEALASILKDFDATSETQNNYYRAILQNLFFATLNQEIDKRGFAEDKNHNQNRSTYNIKNLYRYEKEFVNGTSQIMELFRKVPFLNGGLFECLDNKQKEGKTYDWDGFSRNPYLQANIPNALFFANELKVDLSSEYNDKKKKTEKVTGIIEILKRYNFTVEENTPVEVEVALDPELLGKVFENLLGAFNPETQETARKQTGSFYTPREIVNYMVDESLIAYLNTCMSTTPAGSDICSQELISEHTTPSGSNATTNDISINLSPRCVEDKLRELLGYETDHNPFDVIESKSLIHFIFNCKILDPATGSGAFPMGILQQMVHILRKLDPENTHWNNVVMEQALKDFEAAEELSDTEKQNLLDEIEHSFDDSVNFPDYARKLYLIENCIYGVDIQSIAVQISKLRFFISLVCEQNHSDDATDNFGIRPLPNLETKFVAANTLIGIEKDEEDMRLFRQDKILKLIKKLKEVRHRQFLVTNAQKKKDLREQDETLRHAIVAEVQKLYVKRAEDDIFRWKMQLKQSEKELENLNNKTDIIQTTEEQLDIFGGGKKKTINQTENKRNELKARIKQLNKDITDGSQYARLESVVQLAEQLTSWNPYDQNASSPFFDPEWMFGVNDGFDVVIGNPPYGAEFNKDEKELFKRILKHQDYQPESYLFFVEKGLNLLKSNAVLSYIIPNTWLTNLKLVKIRKFLTSENSILNISHYHKSVFDAVVDTEVVIFSNGFINNNIINVYIHKSADEIELIQHNQNKWRDKNGEVINIFSNEKIENLISKLKYNSLKLSECADVFAGLVPYEEGKGNPPQTREMMKNKIYNSSEKLDNTYREAIRGSDIDKYLNNWNGTRWLKYGNNLAAPRKSKIFDNPKIIIRQTGDTLIATYDDRKFVCFKNTHVINQINDNFDLKYIIALINSKLMNYYFQYLNPEMGEALAEVKKENVEKLLIKETRNQVIFIQLVNEILSLKIEGSIIEAERIEQKIDNLVYRLYSLTYDEVKVIDPEIESKISEADYNLIEIE